jgi:hypothetical protein
VKRTPTSKTDLEWVVCCVKHPELTPEDKYFLLILATHADSTTGQRVIPGNAFMEEATGWSHQTVRLKFRKLERLGLIQCTAFAAGGRNKAREYRLCLENDSYPDHHGHSHKGETLGFPLSETKPKNPKPVAAKGTEFSAKGETLGFPPSEHTSESFIQTYNHNTKVAGDAVVSTKSLTHNTVPQLPRWVAIEWRAKREVHPNRPEYLKTRPKQIREFCALLENLQFRDRYRWTWRADSDEQLWRRWELMVERAWGDFLFVDPQPWPHDFNYPLRWFLDDPFQYLDAQPTISSKSDFEEFYGEIDSMDIDSMSDTWAGIAEILKGSSYHARRGFFAKPDMEPVAPHGRGEGDSQ